MNFKHFFPTKLASRKRSELDVRRSIDHFEELFRTQEGVDYEWVVEYANEKIDSYQDSIKELESKADAMMRYLAGGAALLGAVFSYGSGKNHLEILFLFVPTTIALLVAMLSSGLTTTPGARSKRPLIKVAFQYANSCNQDAQILFLRSTIMIEFDLALMATHKAHLVRIALSQFGFAVTWFVLTCPILLLSGLRLDVKVSALLVGFGLLPVCFLLWFECWKQRQREYQQLDDWFLQMTS